MQREDRAVNVKHEILHRVGREMRRDVKEQCLGPELRHETQQIGLQLGDLLLGVPVGEGVVGEELGAGGTLE